MKNCFDCTEAKLECNEIRCEHECVAMWVEEPMVCKYSSYEQGDISEFIRNIKNIKITEEC